MSLTTEYMRLRPHELTELRRLLAEDPDSAYEYVEGLRWGNSDERASRGMDTDKAWAGLQYLLAKLEPPVDVVGGGEPVTTEWAYDSLRLLTADDVAAAARFLAATPFTSLAQQYDPVEMAAEIYPTFMWGQDWALSYLEGYYVRLVALFRAAAADHEPILIWMG
jgi:hypothetical protein